MGVLQRFSLSYFAVATTCTLAMHYGEAIEAKSVIKTSLNTRAVIKYNLYGLEGMVELDSRRGDLLASLVGGGRFTSAAHMHHFSPSSARVSNR